MADICQLINQPGFWVRIDLVWWIRSTSKYKYDHHLIKEPYIESFVQERNTSLRIQDATRFWPGCHGSLRLGSHFGSQHTHFLLWIVRPYVYLHFTSTNPSNEIDSDSEPWLIDELAYISHPILFLLLWNCTSSSNLVLSMILHGL